MISVRISQNYAQGSQHGSSPSLQWSLRCERSACMQTSSTREFWSVKLKCQVWTYCTKIDYKHFVQQKLHSEEHGEVHFLHLLP